MIKVGWTLTAAWVSTTVTIAYFRFGDFVQMELNQWGDFLAGITAPLALLWLVLGYLQHSREIALQVEEMVKLGEHNERQAEATETLVQLNRDAQSRAEVQEALKNGPEFVFAGATANEITLLNRGGDAYSIEVLYDGPGRLHLGSEMMIESGLNGTLHIDQNSDTSPSPIRFSLVCIDGLDYKHDISLELHERRMLKETWRRIFKRIDLEIETPSGVQSGFKYIELTLR